MVSCEYKFFPMEAISGEYLQVFNQNQDLETFYKSWNDNDYSIPVLYKINYDKLKENGIKCLLFDLDNTCVPYVDRVPTTKLKNHFDISF